MRTARDLESSWKTALEEIQLALCKALMRKRASGDGSLTRNAAQEKLQPPGGRGREGGGCSLHAAGQPTSILIRAKEMRGETGGGDKWREIESVRSDENKREGRDAA